jgi:peptidoglycan/LPS O-acetylase OafA/YrhL
LDGVAGAPPRVASCVHMSMDTAAPRGTSERNAYVDWLRALSLVVVVVWHWAFTMVDWRADGPHATSPIGFTTGFWLLTWLFQVMPLFFYIGGYVHLRSWERARARGVSLASFVGRRMRQLAVPAGLLLAVWVALGALVGWYYDAAWAGRAVRLVVSPLWFLAVYLGLIALLPAALWLHRRYGVLVLVWLAGAAMVVDVLRFRYHIPGIGWLNMLFVWALAHQAGFFYQNLVDAPRRVGWALTWTGLFGLIGLVFSGLYPGSMVGVPGDRFSNMAPPTFVMVALLIFQAGVAELVRPATERALGRPRWHAVSSLINRFALPLFLFHMTGMAISRFVTWLVFKVELDDRTPPDALWWLSRPLAVLGPLLCTLPVIYLFGRHGVFVGRAARPKS